MGFLPSTVSICLLHPDFAFVHALEKKSRQETLCCLPQCHQCPYGPTSGASWLVVESTHLKNMLIELDHETPRIGVNFLEQMTPHTWEFKITPPNATIHMKEPALFQDD